MMRIGYPCINLGVGCTPNSTFRKKSYSEERLKSAVSNNLNCLSRILGYNKRNNILFFRVSSDIVPFASHPICKFNWAKHFREEFRKVGEYALQNGMRLSMHPDQFVVINSPNPDVVERSVRELEYHVKVLDLMGLDESAKIQIHVGGVYGNKDESIERFAENYKKLRLGVRRRLVVENDEKLFSLRDCLFLNEKIGIPVVFDSLHHECLNNGESRVDAISLASETWGEKDGQPIIDYSSQKRGGRVGAHAPTINLKHFRTFVEEVGKRNIDIMLEIKDKERSAMKALKLLQSLNI